MLTLLTFALAGVVAAAPLPIVVPTVRPAAVLALTAPQGERLARLEQQATTVSAHVVDVAVADLLDASMMRIAVERPDTGAVIEFEVARREGEAVLLRNPGEALMSSSVIVKDAERVTATLRFGSEMLIVRPIGNGVHALAVVDQQAFPADHPADFEPIEGTWPAEVRVERATADNVAVVTCVCAWTTRAADEAFDIEALILQSFVEGNMAFENSGAAVRFELLFSYATNYTDTAMSLDLQRFRINGDGFMDEIHPIREEYRANTAMVFTGETGACGVAAAILANKDTAFALTAQNCVPNFTGTHEILHLLAARHNLEADPSRTPYADGHGHIIRETFHRTIMAYNLNGETRVPLVSNPALDYRLAPTGVVGDSDNVRVAEETAPLVGSF